ncbi:MAG: hypothetical protein UV99_C0003G0023 [Parcubacteria group bacterium GW2011_GWC1_43_61]|nr:MAG: hypothetical protein UV99_C0003G0023 [Parcubacteria group bacterium GW2011_GWC1_43_61]
MPTDWDGQKAILEMRDADYPQWRQMEWIGFYFQFFCDKNLAPLMKIPGPKYGRVEFDGFSEIPWDFKAHPNKNANGLVLFKKDLEILMGVREILRCSWMWKALLQ